MEMVTGFFFAGGLRRGVVVYVTNYRIRVNKRKVQNLVKTGLFVHLLLLLGTGVAGLSLVSPELAPWLLILSVVVVVSSRLFERRTARRRWPSVNQVEKGQRRFEVKRGQLLSIELKAPRKLGGYVKIVPLIGDPIVLSVASNKNFTAAREALVGFEPSRVSLVE